MNPFRQFKQLLSKSKSTSACRRPPASPMEHPILGSLAPNKTFPESLSGTVIFGSDQVELLVSPDDKTIDVALELAVALVEQLPQLDAKSRRLVADEFLEIYNTNWRFGETVQRDGTTKSFEKPQLSKEQFCQSLQLTSIEASGEAMLVFWYGDGDMFWGHSLELTSFDGTAFGDTYASMAG
jgi:hypothetical protein